VKINVSVQGFYEEGYAGSGIPNMKGWKAVASDGDIVVSHIITLVEDRMYLDRGFDGYSASAQVSLPFDRGPQPVLTEAAETAMLELLEAFEAARAAGHLRNRGKNCLSTSDKPLSRVLTINFYPYADTPFAVSRREVEARLVHAREGVLSAFREEQIGESNV